MADSQTPVLIVGAGPTGLMAACQLARFGIDFRLIDSKPGPTRESRALAVQARTLEVYQQLGVADRAMEQGHVMSGMNMHANGKHRARVPLGDIGKGLSPFPFLLVLEQSRNEQILTDHLTAQGIEVGWNTSFMSLEQNEEHVEVTVQTTDGHQETIRSQWVIAADGASSPVRHALNMAFGGGTYDERFYVADLQIDGNLPLTEGSVFLAQKGFALVLPMDGERHFRLVGIVPQGVASEDPTFDEIRQDLEPLFQRSLSFGEPNWFTSYTVHHRCVESFQSGRVLFAGDAAHIHSPAGGQGMNTGLLDVHNLCWKLAMVVSGSASDQLVKTYNEERLPFAHQLLHTTDRAFQAAMSQHALTAFVRLHVFPKVIRTAMRFDFTRRRFFETISQTGITHKGRSLSVDHGTNGKPLAAGDRVPDFQVEVDKRTRATHHMLAEPGFVMLDFAAPGQAQKNRQASQELAKKHSVPLKHAEAICLDPQWRDIVEGNTYLIRPDMYVGLATTDLREKPLADYFTQKLGTSA